MTIRKKMTLPVAAALMVLGLMVVAQGAMATHPRPKAASPLYASTVPAYDACTPPGNRTHAPPLNFGSCNPPVQSSPNITVGTPDANGAPANSTGFVRLQVTGTAGGVDDTDVAITGTITDVRCKSGVSACGNANAQDGPDYTGQLQGNATMRITDHNNAPTGAGPFTDTATVVDLAFPAFPATCSNTAATSEGGSCVFATSADVLCGGCIPEGKRMNIELTQVRINDGGTDGLNSTAGNSLAFVQGVFIP